MNKFLDNLLRITLWIWLPFYALYRLTKELIFGKKERAIKPEEENY